MVNFLSGSHIESALKTHHNLEGLDTETLPDRSFDLKWMNELRGRWSAPGIKNFSEHMKNIRLGWSCSSANPIEHVTEFVAKSALNSFESAAKEGKLDPYFSMPALAQSMESLDRYASDLKNPVLLDSEKIEDETQKCNRESARRIVDQLIPKSLNPLTALKRGLLYRGIAYEVLRDLKRIENFNRYFHNVKNQHVSPEIKSYRFAEAIHGIVHSTDSTCSEEEAAHKMMKLTPALLAKMDFDMSPLLSNTASVITSQLLSKNMVRIIHKEMVEDRILPWLRT